MDLAKRINVIAVYCFSAIKVDHAKEQKSNQNRYTQKTEKNGPGKGA